MTLSEATGSVIASFDFHHPRDCSLPRSCIVSVAGRIGNGGAFRPPSESSPRGAVAISAREGSNPRLTEDHLPDRRPGFEPTVWDWLLTESVSVLANSYLCRLVHGGCHARIVAHPQRALHVVITGGTDPGLFRLCLSFSSSSSSSLILSIASNSHLIHPGIFVGNGGGSM